MNTNKVFVNSKKHWRKVFNSLMDTSYHLHSKTYYEQLEELKKLESQGKLTIYYPEKDN